MTRKINIVLILILTLNIIQYNIWQIAWKNFFYHCESIQYLLFFCILHYIVVEKNIWTALLCKIGIIFSLNDLVDLLFFNPSEFNWNDYVSSGIGIIITVYKLRWKILKKQRLH